MRKLLVIALAAVACGPSVTLTTDRLSYEPGEGLTLTLQNDSLSEIGCNLCLSQLIDADGGVIRDLDAGSFCQLRLDLLRSGQRITYVRHLPDSLEAGSYSYRTSLEIDGAQVSTSSNAFEVAP